MSKSDPANPKYEDEGAFYFYLEKQVICESTSQRMITWGLFCKWDLLQSLKVQRLEVAFLKENHLSKSLLTRQSNSIKIIVKTYRNSLAFRKRKKLDDVSKSCTEKRLLWAIK